MSDAESLPFGLSWEVLVMLIATAVMMMLILGNPQVMERILSFIGGNFR